MAWNNYCIFTGRLTKDLEVGTSAKGRKYGRNTIVVDKSYKGADGNYVDKAMFVDVIMYNDKLVEALQPKLQKGALVTAHCELEITDYVSKTGEKRKGHSYVVKEIRVLAYPKNHEGQNSNNVGFSPSNEFSNNRQNNSSSFNTFEGANFDVNDFSAIGDEDDIPF